MAAAVGHSLASGGGSLLAGGLLAAAYPGHAARADCGASRWFVDETTFASFARDVHGDLGQFFVAESDKKGLLPSWLGAGLISAGIAPVTAMRLLAAAGAALAAICGGLLMRRLYGRREGLLTAGADRARAVLPGHRLGRASTTRWSPASSPPPCSSRSGWPQRPRLVHRAAARRRSSAPAASRSPRPGSPSSCCRSRCCSSTTRSPRRAAAAAGLGRATRALALALGYAITSIARLTPLYDQPISSGEPARRSARCFDDLGPVAARATGRRSGRRCIGYLTIPGIDPRASSASSSAGAATAPPRDPGRLDARGDRLGAAARPLTEYPRYFATAMVPLSGFVALGALARLGRDRRRVLGDAAAWRIAAAVAVAAIALLPAARFDGRVLADPGAREPTRGWTRCSTSPRTARRRGSRPSRGGSSAAAGRIRCRSTSGRGYPVGPRPRAQRGDLRRRARRFDVFVNGKPAERARARYFDQRRARRPVRAARASGSSGASRAATAAP